MRRSLGATRSTAAKSRPKPSLTFTDAIALLKADHRNAAALFDKFEQARSGARPQLAQQIGNDRKIHPVIEEEIFFPALKGRIDDGTWTEADVEHDGAKLPINAIMAASPDDDAFHEAGLKVLADEIRHRGREADQRVNGMFAQARAARVDLVERRDLMLARERALLAQGKAEPLPPAQTSVLQPG